MRKPLSSRYSVIPSMVTPFCGDLGLSAPHAGGTAIKASQKATPAKVQRFISKLLPADKRKRTPGRYRGQALNQLNGVLWTGRRKLHKRARQRLLAVLDGRAEVCYTERT